MSDEKPVVFLRGQKTILRPLMKSDMPTVVRWINDPDIREFINMPFSKTEAEEDEWFRALGRDDKNVTLAIETLEKVFIGVMGIHEINWIDRVATTGAFIGEKEYWGKGFGTDAKMILLEYAFHTLNLRKLCSRVVEYNRRSLAYSDKCGYRPDGVRKEHLFRKGRYWDQVELAIFEEDWLPIWEMYREYGIIPKRKHGSCT